jgi:hypothetical protein
MSDSPQEVLEGILNSYIATKEKITPPKPKIEKRKLILTNSQSPGDGIAMLYAIHCLHKAFPNQYLTDVRCPYRDIFEFNPLITNLNITSDVQQIKLGYPEIHISTQCNVSFINGMLHELESKLKIKILKSNVRGFLHISDQEKSWISAIREIIGYDAPYWIIGDKAHIHPPLSGNNLINLVGKTTLRQLIRLVYHSYGVITPVSLPMMLAISVPVNPMFRKSIRPCVVISGGREPNHYQQLPGHYFFHTIGQLDCCQEACWRSRVVPIGDGDEKDRTNLCLHPIKDNQQHIPLCLDKISSSDVINVIKCLI